MFPLKKFSKVSHAWNWARAWGWDFPPYWTFLLTGSRGWVASFTCGECGRSIRCPVSGYSIIVRLVHPDCVALSTACLLHCKLSLSSPPQITRSGPLHFSNKICFCGFLQKKYFQAQLISHTPSQPLSNCKSLT